MIFWSIVSPLQISVTPLFSYCSCKEGTCSEMFEASICHQDLGCHSHTKDIQRYYSILDERAHERIGILKIPCKPIKSLPFSTNTDKLSDSNKNAAFSTESFPFFGPASAWLHAPPSIQVQGDAPPAVGIETAWGFNGIKVELFADL